MPNVLGLRVREVMDHHLRMVQTGQTVRHAYHCSAVYVALLLQYTQGAVTHMLEAAANLWCNPASSSG